MRRIIEAVGNEWPRRQNMDCCGHGHVLTRRRWIWSTLTSVAAMVGGGVGPRGSTAAEQIAETIAAALAVLRDSISVDVHTHGGASGITSTAPPSDDLAKAMRTGSLAVACLADVPDTPILTRSEAGVLNHSDAETWRSLQIPSRAARLGGRDGRYARPAPSAFRSRSRGGA